VNNVTNEMTAVWSESARTLTETQTSSHRATPSVRVQKYGRTISETSTDGGRNFFFDPYGRVFYTERRPSVSSAWLSETWLGFNDFGDVAEHDAFIASGSTYAITSYAFDAFGHETVRVDALGNAVTNTYDALGRCVATSGATYPVTHGFDTAGRATALSTTRDGGVWDSTAWLYNVASGLITNKVYADDTTVSFSYDEASRPLRTTWARGEWREHAYNADGLLTATTYSDATPDISLAYDAFQRLVGSSNAVAAYVYSNDALGAATNETASIGTTSHQIARQYDRFQRLASLTIDVKPVLYSYDDENRLSTVSNNAFTVAYAYTPDGWDAGYNITLTNGTVLSRTVTRDPYRRHLVTGVSNAVAGSVAFDYHYNYDLLGQVTSRNSDTFCYNARSEVISAITAPSHTNRYEFDAIGNNRWTSVNAATNIYSANELNQYTNIANGTVIEPAYDLDGNMTWDGRLSYTWDAENRLSAVYSNSTCIVSNSYDHQSRRVLKTTATATHAFVYDGWNLVLETIATASGVTTNRYVWGKDLSGTFQGAGGVGGLLAVSMNGSCFFPFYDNNGNIIAYESESGELVAEYVYDAFGRTIAHFGPMANAFPHRFSTKYYDSETGLSNYGYRFYSSDLMRWLNRDPIEENGGRNLFSFVNNDPMSSFDQLGLVRIFYSAKGTEIGRDRGWLFWSTTKFIQGKTGNIEWCGKRFWRVRRYDAFYLPGEFSGVEEKWEPKMRTFYLANKNTSWFYKNFPYGYLFALGTVLENSPQNMPWDYKRNLDAEKWYIFKNEAYRDDSIGNIAWGAIMRSYGFPRQFALMGAGAQQLRDDYTSWKNGNLTLWQFATKNRNVYGDEGRDGIAISDGFGWNP
jgi:RHS repeat-associated protein